MISTTVSDVGRLFKACELRLKGLVAARFDGQKDEEVRKNICSHFASQLQDLSQEFRRGHKGYLSKLKGQTIEDYRPDLSLNAGPSEAAGASGSTSFFDDEPAQPDACNDPRFSAAQTLQLVMQERMSEEREKQITQVCALPPPPYPPPRA